MQQQNYANHRKMDPSYHYLLTLLVLIVSIGSLWYLFASSATLERVLFLLTSVILVLLFIKTRGYALKAQDRAIRAEEQVRHYILTGQPLDSSLSLKQIIALRFAGDDEFASLSRRAAEEKLTTADIKKAIVNWRADHDRL
jgi:TRAP-type uncharacterized transport system fused permease subunit